MAAPHRRVIVRHRRARSAEEEARLIVLLAGALERALRPEADPNPSVDFSSAMSVDVTEMHDESPDPP